MSDYRIQDEGALLKNSAFDLLTGKCLGSGASRRVYEITYDKSLVLKVEHAGRTFHNQMEWLIWEEVKDWPIADWFAPCVDIDGYGNVMIQKRTEPFKSDKEFKAAITRTRGGVVPKLFDDIHYGNFGLRNGVVTCHDYGYTKFFEQIAREMSVDAGYIKYDDESVRDVPKDFDITEGGQLALDL